MMGPPGMGPGMGMPGMGMPGGMTQQPGLDEEAYRAQLMAEKEAKDAERKRRGREVYKELEKERDSARTSLCIYYIIAGDVVSMSGILFAFFLQGWAYCNFAGLGISTMEVSTGMFDIDINIRCKKTFLEDLICKVAQKLNGCHRISHFVGITCSLPGTQACQDFQRVGQASSVVLGVYMWCLVCLIISVVCAYFYWHKDPDPRWRMRAYILGITGPVSMFVALIIWVFLMPQLSRMPQSWIPFGGFAGNTLFGYKPIENPPFGRSYLVAMGFTILAFIFNSMLPCYLRKHPKEIEHEEARVLRLEELEDRLDFVVSGGNINHFPGQQQPGSMPQPGFAPQPGFGPQPGFAPQPVIGPQPGMSMQGPTLIVAQGNSFGPGTMQGPTGMGPGMAPGTQPAW